MFDGISMVSLSAQVTRLHVLLRVSISKIVLLARPRKKVIACSLALFCLLTVFLVRLTQPASRVISVLGDYNDNDETWSGADFLAQEDAWEPATDYDPVKEIWRDFPGVYDKYGSSVSKLENNQGLPRKTSQSKYDDESISCIGSRGISINESLDDTVYSYAGRPKGFPKALLGTSHIFESEQNSCFDRYGRYGVYGLGTSMSHPSHREEDGVTDWDEVNWAALQSQCLKLNRRRFDLRPRPVPGTEAYRGRKSSSGPSKKRQAVLFRTFTGFEYNSNIIQTMRSVISELALKSGGEFEVFNLVEVKDVDIPIFSSSAVYNKVIRQWVPPEFRNMTVLWNQKQWDRMYPMIPEYFRRVHNSQWLAVQWFSLQHPEFDYYWNWEMDIRYTGHHYQLANQLDNWTRKQPRKGLWERNARFYIPQLHGTYAHFTRFVQAKYLSRSFWGKVRDNSIWGPKRPAGVPKASFDNYPPAYTPTPLEDNYTWGVGEDADLITLLPMFDPAYTHYGLKFDFWNYPKGKDPEASPIRRSSIITFRRLSHRLVSTMHIENIRKPGHHMGSETWPESVALHHGYKAVYAPHPIYFDRKWPAKALDFHFNWGDVNAKKKPGQGSGGMESAFGWEREHNFLGGTWYYRADFAGRLYSRFLGNEVDSIGGKKWEGENGLYCLPPMLLHPIKNIIEPPPELS